MSLKPIDSGALRKSAKQIAKEIQYSVKYEYPPMHKLMKHKSVKGEPYEPVRVFNNQK